MSEVEDGSWWYQVLRKSPQAKSPQWQVAKSA